MRAGLCALFIGGLLTSVVARPATAQSTHRADGLAGDAATVTELAEMLTSPNVAQRNHAFRRVTDLARRSPEVDLTSTVPILGDIYENDPDEKYRLAAISALYLIGDERGMTQARQRVLREPSLLVQYVSVAVLADHYGPEAFGRGTEELAMAKNVLARRREAKRLARHQRLVVVPRVIVGPLEVVQQDSLQQDSLQQELR